MKKTVSKKKADLGVSDDAVRKATGESWSHWLAALDKAGAADMPHKEIAALLRERHGLSGWWSQSVAVGYEQARGKRAKGESADGFQAGVSRTMGVPVGELYKAWSSPRTRARWLEGAADIEVRTATKDKSMRITWIDGRTSVEAYFTDKGAEKSQVAVQHRKLSSAAQRDRMKRHWSDQLDRLREMLEGSSG